MTDFKLTFQQRYFDRIEEHYNHLTDAERNRLIYLRNMRDKKGKLEDHDFNELKDLAESLEVKTKEEDNE